MNNLYEKAREAQDEGEYEEAARFWAIGAFDRLMEAHFRPNRGTRIGITIMLRAVSCDVQAGNDERAKHLFDIVRPMFAEIRETSDDAVLAGLAAEWIGDGYLMLGNEKAIDHYQQAATRYEGSVRPAHPWGGEEEYDYAQWALDSFLESKGHSLPEHPSVYFEDRIEHKLEIASDLLSV